MNAIPPRWRRRLYLALFLAVAFLLGSAAQERLGVSFTVEGLEAFRHWVQSLGWWGPAVFILLVVFRLFIGLSSHLVLILGGLAFGATGGILWGCIGLVASALLLFYFPQLLGADWVQRRFGDQYTPMLDRIRRIGALSIFALTAHPLGLLTPAHLAAGRVGLSAGQFAVAVLLAAPVRAAPYALLGTAVLDLSAAQSLTIAGVLLGIFVLPLLHPMVRSWIWTGRGADDEVAR